MQKDFLIKRAIGDSINTKNKILGDSVILLAVERIADEAINSLKGGKKILLCGNGGSAADAQHIAAELSGKFYFDRDPLFAEALHTNTSFLTAVANDYSYGEVYSRLVKAMGKEGDILIGISTSGNSENVVKAIEVANSQKMITVGFTGQGGGKMKNICNHLVAIPSSDTPRIQEAHILVGHIICEIIETEIFKNKTL